MRANHLLPLILLLSADILSASPVPLTEGQRADLLREAPDAKLFLNWWESEDGRKEANAAFEKANGLGAGDAVRLLAGIAEAELALPGGGDSNTVARALDALAKSGDPFVTNLLDRLLFKADLPWREAVFCTRARFAVLEHRDLAGRTVRGLQAKERRKCYTAALAKTCGEWSTRRKVQTSYLLQECAAVEDDAELAALLDDGLARTASSWVARNTRRRVAERFAGAPERAGEHFRRIAEEMGKPQQAPTEKDVIFWLLGPMDDSGVPPFWYETLQRFANRLFAQDYGMTEIEVVRFLEKVLSEVLDNKRGGRVLTGNLVTALVNSGDPGSAEVLKRALFAEWNPSRGWTLSAYLHLAGDSSLPVARRVAADTRLFEPMDRHILYDSLYESAEARGGEWKRAVVAFLRERTASEEDQGKTTILDGLLLKADPGWARSEGRRRLAARIAAQTPETPVVIGFRNLLKEIGEPSGAP